MNRYVIAFFEFDDKNDVHLTYFALFTLTHYILRI